MRQYFLLLIYTFSASCIFAQQLSFDKITVLNLEEDKGPFATLNDEIAVWAVKINNEKDMILSWEHTEEMIFSDSIPSYDLDFERTLNLDSHEVILIVLIEFDNKHGPDSIDMQLKKTLMEFYDFPLTLLKEKIRLSLGDDDILGITSFQFGDKKLQNEKIIFKGMHMFNRFEYELSLR